MVSNQTNWQFTNRSVLLLLITLGLIAVLAVSISLLRLVMVRADAITEILWAEDGIFALCARDFPVLSCTFEPYAGYLNFLPRILAFPVSKTPLELWPLAANAIAAISVALIAVLTYAWLWFNGSNSIVSALCALTPALLPIASTESINSSASIYGPLLYVTALTQALPLPFRISIILGSTLVFVAALTTPLAFVLLPIILANYFLYRKYKVRSIWPLIAFVSGISVQVLVILRARTFSTSNRTIEISEAIWSRLIQGYLQLIKGMFSIYPIDSNDYNSSFALALALFMVVIVLRTLYGITVTGESSRWQRSGSGLIFSGLLSLGFAGIVIHLSDRYLVTPALLILGGLLVLLNGVRRPYQTPLAMLVFALLMLSWLPSLPASEFRTKTTSGWSAELARLESVCQSSDLKIVPVKLAPYWFLGHTYSGAGPIINCKSVLGQP
jgi:hypothetical protein